MKNINKSMTLAGLIALCALPSLCHAAIHLEAQLDGVASHAAAISFEIRDLRGPLGIIRVKPGWDGIARFNLDLPDDQPYCIKVAGYTSDAILEGDTTCRLRFMPGDVNGDNSVDLTDYSMLAKCYNTEWGDEQYLESADFDGDGTIDIADYALLSEHFGLRGAVPVPFVPFAYPGDIDGDGMVGNSDFKIIEMSWEASPKDENYDEAADLNQDGWIDIADYAILSQAWGSVYPAR